MSGLSNTTKNCEPCMETTTDGRRRHYAHAIALYELGWSVARVAQQYGRTRQAMWGWLKARGVTFRPHLRYGEANHFHRGGTTASDPAQNKLEKALQRGRISRSATCEACGTSARFKDGRTAIQAHHPDYNKPLNVMWLCQPCHHRWHQNNHAVPTREGT
jgi:transposase-like protein